MRIADLTAKIELLRVTQGRFAGRHIRVLPWQKRFLRGAFCGDAETAALSIARGGGKTTLMAAVATLALLWPEMRRARGEIILCAASFAQAKIAFDHILAFMAPLIRADKRKWRVADSSQHASIEHRATGARVRCIGADPRRAHGLAPALVLADEPAQWPPNTSERMVAALRTAAGKIPDSRFVAIGTRPDSETHWFAKMLAGGADYAQSYAAPDDDPPFRKATWVKANPSLPHMPDLERATRKEAQEARKDPALLAAFRALRLNQGTPDTEQAHLLDAALWKACEGQADADGATVWGIDLGTSAAQSAIACYWPETGRLQALAAFPSEPSLAERGLRDGVGSLYVQCAARGELLTLGQRATDIPALLRAALDLFGEPALLASDRWREAELRDALEAAGVPPARLEARGMGYLDGGEDVRTFRRAFAEGKVTPFPSLLLRGAMAEARTVSDPAGNAKLAKGSEGGRRTRARDDAAAAGILAVSAGVRHRERLPATGTRQGVYLGL